MDTSRNDLLGEIAADAALERSDFLVQATEQFRKFLDANRSRIDALGGLWGPLKRAVVRARTRSSVRDNLAAARMLVERRFETLASGTARQGGPRAQSRDRD